MKTIKLNPEIGAHVFAWRKENTPPNCVFDFGNNVAGWGPDPDDDGSTESDDYSEESSP